MDDRSRIMCAVDLTWRSESAFNYAVAIAKARRAHLDLLFAISDRSRSGRHVRQRVAQLAHLRRRSSEAGVDMGVTVQHGRPADVILQLANSAASPPQLIVLGAPSHRRGLDRFRSPSVALAVVHGIDRPTLVVPGPEVETGIAVPFRRVVCAIDFSSASMSALDEAYRIVEREAASMRLLHVVNIVQPALPRVTLECPAVDYTEQLRNDAWHQLRRLLPLSRELHGRVHLEVAVGLVVDQIVRHAQEFNADLVVLGASRRGRLGRLLQSTTGHALQRLNCPVLAVPELRADVGAAPDRIETPRVAA